MKRALLTISILLLFSLSVFSEIEPIFHHYTTEDGLFHNEIRLIRKARNGMLWLGTQNGLSSFDGYRFTVYKHDANNSNSICSDKIYALETSAAGEIWVGTTSGLCILNPVTEKARAFKDTFNVKSNIENDYVRCLLEDRSGYLWISNSSGNYRYSVYNNTLEPVLNRVEVDNYFESREGNFWICHGNEVSTYNRNSKIIIKSFPVDIDKLYNDRFGVLWGVGPEGLFRFMPGKGKFELLKAIVHPLKKGFKCIAEDKDGDLFLGNYGNGITIYSPKTNEVNYLRAEPNAQYAVSSNDVYDIFSDEAGVVWIGTQEGLDVSDWSRQRFIKWKHHPNQAAGLSNSFIQSIYRNKQGELWLGTRDNGLEKLKSESSISIPEFEHFPSKDNFEGISGSYVAGMMEDSKQRFWVASLGGGLSMKTDGSTKWKHFRNNLSDANSIAGNEVVSVLEDRKGRILVGTLSGLSIVLEEINGNYCFKNYTAKTDNKRSLSGNAIFTVKEDSKGRIWIGTNNTSLNLMHEELDGEIWFEHFWHNSEDSTSISNNEVFVVFEDSKQRLWVGTSSLGFNLVIEEPDENGKSSFSFKSYTEKDGLADNEVNAFLEDDFGYLWISTNKGISRFNPDKETFDNYSEYDGVLKGKFRKNAAWKDDDGTMYFGGAAGVNVFNPTHFPKNEIPPKPFISGLIIDNIKYNLGDSLGNILVFQKMSTDELLLTLPKSNNRFELELSALSFTSPKRNKYEWKLDGIDSNWHNTEGNNPKISYSGLEAGKYQLTIRASNNDGIWTNKPIHVLVNVKGENPLQSYLLMGAILFIGVLIILVLRKSKSIQNKTSKDKSISNEETELAERLTNLMIDEELFLDFKLGLSEMADKLQISTNQLSALLNDVVGKSFYDYVNEFRIEEVKKRLVLPEDQNKTILSIAWECGFNSKSAFNRVFKINTGLTPSEYQKKHSKK